MKAVIQATENTPRETVLVGDIGGTNARFAVIGTDAAVKHKRTLKVEDYGSFDAALSAFLAEVDEDVHAACIAVAGPVANGRASFTNSSWTINEDSIEGSFSLDDVLVVNDFEALSRFALMPQTDDVIEVKPGTPMDDAPVLTIGPGTGLGQGIVVPHKDCGVLVATEGGHVLLSAMDKTEWAIKEIVANEVGRPPSAEDILCGSGLVRLYNAMSELSDWGVQMDSPARITDAAAAGDANAVAVIHQFCAFLGTVAGNAALATGARGGVMLAGGILPRVPDLLLSSPFATRFVGQSLMMDYLKAIPVNLLTAGDAALRGAAAILRDPH